MSALVRLVGGAALGVVVAAVVLAAGFPRFSLLGGWTAAALVFTTWTWAGIWRMDARATATHATREEPTRLVTHLLVLGSAVASLVGVGLLLLSAGDASVPRVTVAVVAVLCVVVSWSVVPTLFALAYARQYYTGPDGGIDFHDDAPPRYSDFGYLAFTVGMSFAVSDTDITAYAVRRTVLAQALLSYLFGSVILASLINLVVGL